MAPWLTITGRFILRLLVSALVWALGIAFVLGIFGILASIADNKPDLWWQVAAFGAYLGVLAGIGEGIKGFFGVVDESEPTGKELAQEWGKNVLGNLVPGLDLLNLAAEPVFPTGNETESAGASSVLPASPRRRTVLKPRLDAVVRSDIFLA
jgi:hypothetical protein